MVDRRLYFCAPSAAGIGFHFFTPKINATNKVWRTLILKALEYKLFLISLFTVTAWSVFSVMRRWSHWAQILIEVFICWLWLWMWLPWDVINHPCVIYLILPKAQYTASDMCCNSVVKAVIYQNHIHLLEYMFQFMIRIKRHLINFLCVYNPALSDDPKYCRSHATFFPTF